MRDAEELATDETPLPAETLARIADVIACDRIEGFEVDRVHRRDLPLDGMQDDRWWEIAHQHPICSYVEETGDFRALRISDFLTRAEFHRLELYDERFRPYGYEYSIMLPLRSPPWHERGFDLMRARRDFSERDREVLDVLSPHLLRVARTFELLADVPAGKIVVDATNPLTALELALGFSIRRARQWRGSRAARKS